MSAPLVALGTGSIIKMEAKLFYLNVNNHYQHNWYIKLILCTDVDEQNNTSIASFRTTNMHVIIIDYCTSQFKKNSCHYSIWYR